MARTLAERMFDTLILGVDPGTASVGLAAVAQEGPTLSVAWYDTVVTANGEAPAKRLRRIHEAVGQALASHRPGAMALERLMWGRNTGSGMEVARASGVIALAAAEAGVPVEEYAPLEVKMAVTGVGNATKGQVRRSLTRLLRVQGVPSDPDAADAVAVAVCHLQQSRLRALTGGSSR
jgi:crossover junction endodeoxyribonuclease RuvC